MAGEIYEKYYDSEKPEETVYDNEKLSKSIQDIQKSITEGMSTKDEFDIIESSLKYWHDGDVRPELFDES